MADLTTNPIAYQAIDPIPLGNGEEMPYAVIQKSKEATLLRLRTEGQLRKGQRTTGTGMCAICSGIISAIGGLMGLAAGDESGTSTGFLIGGLTLGGMGIVTTIAGCGMEGRARNIMKDLPTA